MRVEDARNRSRPRAGAQGNIEQRLKQQMEQELKSIPLAENPHRKKQIAKAIQDKYKKAMLQLKMSKFKQRII